MKTTLGPILYFWSREEVMRFYHELADTAVHTVYLGETVCSKRRELMLADYLSIAHILREAGKQVVLSTMTLIESPADLRMLKRYCDNGEFLVEANDMGAVGLLREQRLPFVAGAAINCYNPHSLWQLLQFGMQRWIMPVELSSEWLLKILHSPIIKDVRNQFTVEVFAFGHLPLAWSARCFTARSENRPKDQCQLCCKAYPMGRSVSSQEGDELFLLNGIQTQSGGRYNLINDIPAMQGVVDYLRLSPQREDMASWVQAYTKAIAGKPHRGLAPGDINGYWRKLAGIVVVDDEDEPVN